MILNTFRCEVGGEEISASNYNELYWEAQRQGWVLLEAEPVPVPICPDHVETDGFGNRVLSAPSGVAWEAGCSTCEWEEQFFTEEEAKRAKYYHRCSDYRDEWEMTYIRSPEEIRREAKQRAERYERAKQRREEEEREALYKEAVRLEEQEYLLALAEEGRKWLAIKYRLRHPIKSIRFGLDISGS